MIRRYHPIARTGFLTGTNRDLVGDVFQTESDNREIETCYVCVHGLGDHSATFERLADRVVNGQSSLIAFDQRGHGRSPGRRGGPRDYVALLDDIASARRDAVARFPRARQILVGHSMGGNLVINYALRRCEIDQASQRPAGLVLLSPMLQPPKHLGRPQIAAAWLTGHLLPWLRVNCGAAVDQLTADEDAGKRLTDDAMRHGRLSIYLATQLLSQGRHAIDHARDLAEPVLMLFGRDDQLVDQDAIRNTAARMKCPIEIREFFLGRHDIINDGCGDAVCEAIQGWTDAIADRSETQVPHRISVAA